MFGFSLAELFLVLLAILIFIKPQDLPEIARFLGKMIYHGKRFYQKIKDSLRDLEKQFEIDELKNEINHAISEEKIKYEDDDSTTIVDIYGNEHKVNNLHEVRQDLSAEDLQKEIAEHNQKNLIKNAEINTENPAKTILPDPEKNPEKKNPEKPTQNN